MSVLRRSVKSSYRIGSIHLAGPSGAVFRAVLRSHRMKATERRSSGASTEQLESKNSAVFRAVTKEKNAPFRANFRHF